MAASYTRTNDSRSLSDLIAELREEVSSLASQEVQLAKIEMSSKVSGLGKDAAFVGLGGALAYAGFLGLMAAAMFALWIVMPLWLAALLVGVVVLLVGAGLIQFGLSRLKRRDLTPRHTLASLKEDQEWTRRQASA